MNDTTTELDPIYLAIRRTLLSASRSSWDAIEVDARYVDGNLDLTCCYRIDGVDMRIENLPASASLAGYFRELGSRESQSQEAVSRMHYVLYADGEFEFSLT